MVAAESAPSSYAIRLIHVSPPLFSVDANLAAAGDALEMTTTRPADLAAIDTGGWPVLVRNLRITDDQGRSIEATRAGAVGWRLARPYTGRLHVHYEVDDSLLAENHWPAERESVFADESHVVLVGRSLFITTPAATVSRVRFDLPKPWVAVTPWRRESATTFSVSGRADLQENLIALSKTAPDVITARGFRVFVVALGQWESARSEVKRVLRAVIPQLVRIMGFREHDQYVVALLPLQERGGESFRRSFAMTTDEQPTRENSAGWGNTIAHEVFHYWNGWRLRGTNYASSQWFQEGFTEYAANIALPAAGLIDADGFREKLSQHVRNYQRLKTTLEAPGTQKGPPLYSGGALVAFLWDVLMRHDSGGRRSIADFYRALWKATDGGRQTYDWATIASALNATAPGAWEEFHRRYIAGDERLPLTTVLPLAGLRLVNGAGGLPQIEVDDKADPAARSLWQAMTAGAPKPSTGR